ncbi:MAG: FecR domain-containing protein [Planctomycetota bacterium]
MNSAELRRLVERYHTNELTAEEVQALEKMLEDPAARRLFVEDLTLVSALRHALKVEYSGAEALAESARAASGRTAAVVTPAPTEHVRLRREWRARALALAALLLLVAGAAVSFYWITRRNAAGGAQVAQNPKPLPGKTPGSTHGLTGGEPLAGAHSAAPGVNRVLSGTVVVEGQPVEQIADGAFARCPKAAAQVRLEDGSLLDLTPLAAVTLSHRKVELQFGTARLEVDPAATPFTVATRIGTVTAVGTKFSVALAPVTDTRLAGDFGTMTVAVTEGQVRVDCAAARTVLKAGDTQVFNTAATTVQPLPKVLQGFNGLLTGNVVSLTGDSFVLEIVTAVPKGRSKRLPDAEVAGVRVTISLKNLKPVPKLQLNKGAYVQVKTEDGVLMAVGASGLKQPLNNGSGTRTDDQF